MSKTRLLRFLCHGNAAQERSQPIGTRRIASGTLPMEFATYGTRYGREALDRSSLEKRLQEAVSRLALGCRLLDRQMKIVAARERTGMDATAARAMLDVLQQVQETQEIERNRLMKALADQR